ncbi:12914_t:CDS:10 [Entrophospora sp. SA101]|nr:12914_t:CDS:10 [Entrophospora sp. SA101]
MASIGKIYSYPNNPRVFKVLIAAIYNGVDLEVSEFEFGTDNKKPEYLNKFHTEKVPTFENTEGDTFLTESGAIAYYVATQKEDTQLLGKDKKETAKVINWIFFAENEITPQASTWINPILGISQYNKASHNLAVDSLKNTLSNLDKILLNQTYLVGDRITLADISVATALYLPFKLVLDSEFRKAHKNISRWYVTLINQPPFKKVLGDVTLADVAAVYTPPKKEKKESKPKESPQPKKAEAAVAGDDDDEVKPEPKPKSKLDSLPPSKLNLDEWKRVYSNNDTRPVAVNWFWEHFDPEGYSIWRVDYKYNSELTKVFMSSNLIGGFYNRLDRARKYAFGSLLVLGEDNKNEIAGYFVIRVSDAADFESYEFKKVDPSDSKTKESFEAFIAWDEVLDGKKFADGKGYAFSNRTRPEIITNSVWPDSIGKLKINSVLQYDKNLKNVKSWGYQALSKGPTANDIINDVSKNQIVELFKLHLSEKISVEEKPKLPDGLDFTKAITDYLHAIARWPGIKFKQNVFLILTVPSEWSSHAKLTIKKCAYDAKLINNKDSSNLQIITEPEAAAMYCRKLMKKHFFRIRGKKYLIVDCGGGTVDLTMRKLLPNKQLGEVTEHSGDLCGGSFVDLEFVKYIGRKVGGDAIKSLKEKKHGQYQYMIQKFCDNVKFKFKDGENENFEYDFDIEEICPALKDYITDELKENEWVITLDYETVKTFFDPVIGRIIRLIRRQLEESDGDCSAIFLVGGFSESLYLQKRIKGEFKKHVSIVSVPSEPACAVVRGAVEYGLNTENGGIRTFHQIAKKGQRVEVGRKFSNVFKSRHADKKFVKLALYISERNDTKYCDEPGVHHLGQLIIQIPDVHSGINGHIEFECTFCFDRDEITAIVKNKEGGREYKLVPEPKKK